MNGYSIRGGDEGKARLDILARALRPTTLALLERVGVPAAARCIDLGCGGGHVTREIAHRVGSDGVVVGIDIDARIVELARQDAAADGVANIEFRAGDVSRFDDQDLDLVYARLLLCHVPDPAELVARAATRLRPGGLLVVEEPDFSACFSWPRHDAYDRCMALQREVIRSRGGEPDLGPQLPSIFLDAGLRDVGLHVFQPAFLEAPFKDIPHLSLEKMADAITAGKLATSEEVQALTEAVRVFASDDRSLLSSCRACSTTFAPWRRRYASRWRRTPR